MNRFYGGSNNLYGGELNNEDSIKDTTKDIFKKEKLTKQKKEQGQGQGQGDGQKTTNSFKLSRLKYALVFPPILNQLDFFKS